MIITSQANNKTIKRTRCMSQRNECHCVQTHVKTKVRQIRSLGHNHSVPTLLQSMCQEKKSSVFVRDTQLFCLCICKILNVSTQKADVGHPWESCLCESPDGSQCLTSNHHELSIWIYRLIFKRSVMLTRKRPSHLFVFCLLLSLSHFFCLDSEAPV